MGLVAVHGDSGSADHAVMSYALSHTPTIVIDCANVANVHRWFSLFPYADYSQVYVYEFELLYKLRDALLVVEAEARKRHAGVIVVTSMRHLFHYQNDAENAELYSQAWELLAALGKKFDVRVAIDQKMLAWARKAKAEVQEMGHVVWSQRQNLEQMINELHSYSKALRPEERKVFDELLRVPLRHVGPLSNANSLNAWSFLLLSIIVEQEKRLAVVERHAGVAYRRLPNEEQRSLVVTH